MERRFACTVCGKCCQGWLPLTIADALIHAHRFPLAVLWSTVRQGSKAFTLTRKLGFAFDRKTALRITPLAYIPPTLSCPALDADNRCSIHAEKPLRCRVMPFSADREMADQDDLLIPRKDWLCDVSEVAPAVYRDGRISDDSDFLAERKAFQEQAPVMANYAESLLKRAPQLRVEIEKLAKRPAGGQMVLKFSTLLRKVPGADLSAFATRQSAALQEALSRLPPDAEADYRKNYADWLEEMTSLSKPHGEPL